VRAVRSPVRPATRWIRVVSMASASVIAGRMVVSRRASIDVPGTLAPSMKNLKNLYQHPYLILLGASSHGRIIVKSPHEQNRHHFTRG
jgi:hypothetical protein